MSQNVTILGHWNSRKAKSPPSLSWGEERTKILLLACCYQEVRYSPVLWVFDLPMLRPEPGSLGDNRHCSEAILGSKPPRSNSSRHLPTATQVRCKADGGAGWRSGVETRHVYRAQSHEQTGEPRRGRLAARAVSREYRGGPRGSSRTRWSNWSLRSGWPRWPLGTRWPGWPLWSGRPGWPDRSKGNGERAGLGYAVRDGKRIGTRGESGGQCGDKFLVRERHQGQRGWPDRSKGNGERAGLGYAVHRY